MRLTKASLFLAALLALGACDPDEPDPPPPTPQLGEVTVSCQPASVALGSSAQCTASARDQNGNPFTVSSYTWTSSAQAVATVDATGKVTPVSVGTANISASATAGGVTRQGQAAVTVTAAPATIHNGNVTANETWRAANNPHVVESTIEVIGATLTIEAGVEIRFSQDAELRVTTGMLKAQGTQQAPIRMVSNQGTPTKGYWRGVVFAAGGGSTMSYTTLSHCGAASGEDACIVLASNAAPVLQNVTVQNSSTVGVSVADDGSAFGAGSAALSVSDSGSYAVRIASNQASSIPAGSTFTNNAPNAIELYGNVSRTQTWPNPGVPFVVNDHVTVEGATTPTLTISAGTVLRFGGDKSLNVGSAAPGNLIVDGTATATVLLTADALSAQPGHWRGVHLGSQSAAASRISHATIEFAGAGGNVGLGNLNLYGNAAGGGARPRLENVMLRNSGAYGLYMENEARIGTGSTMLSAHDNGSYAIVLDPNFAGTIPTGGTFTGNTNNAVELRGGAVFTTQTWPNLGIPYVVNGSINVTGSSPTLTIPGGTEVRFGAGHALTVGAGGDPGVLMAVGTAAAPIRFVPNSLTPTKGHWRGIHFWYANGSKLDYVTVTYAGASGNVGTGNVNVYREIGGFITNSTFRNSSGCGITVSDGSYTDSTAVTTNFTQATYNNSFGSNDGGSQCTN